MFDDELRVCPKCGGTKVRDGELCPTCVIRFKEYRARKMKELKDEDMAFRKKPVNPVAPEPDDVAKLKQEITAATNEMLAAAKGLVVPMDTGSIGNDWEQAKSRVNSMDQEFADVEVRVMQIGPDGRLTDVSDRVSPRDLRPEQIEGFQSSDGSVRLPRRPSGEIDHEATLDLMAQLVGIKRDIKAAGPSPAMREMEVQLAESDKLLAKLRR